MAFALEMPLRILAAAGLVVVVSVAAAGMIALSPAEWWVYAGLSAIAAAAAWLLIRVWGIRVSYDATHLRAVGAMWSRRIPRGHIIAVDREPGNAWVTWRSPSGRIRMTPLTAVWANNWGWLPETGRTRRREFLAHLARWASR
ncbi:hypothetical protein SAMN04487846_3442 [Microbacterium sp. cf046]|nr:hypothetical protein SAMN04487846_3442 [Microbacterium sp. cf046]